MTRAMHKYYHKIIIKAVERDRTQAGEVYTHDLIQSTGIPRQTITNWLKANGFRKSGGPMSRYWQAAVAG